MGIQLIKSGKIEMQHRGGPPGVALVGRAISSDISQTMGAGIAYFDKCSVKWRVLYDEVIYVIEGTFELEADSKTFTADVGDIMWIPKGTSLTYKGDKAKIFYIVYPGNWKELT